jgi:hypothetical protein
MDEQAARFMWRGPATGVETMKWILAFAVLAVVPAAQSADAAVFDARNPVDTLSVVSSEGASGQLKMDQTGQPFIDGKAGSLSFKADFNDCSDKARVCQSVAYSAYWDSTSITATQINRWNQWTLMCPAYLDTNTHHPHVWYAMKLFASQNRADTAREVNMWESCLSNFDTFVNGPDNFFKSH